MTYATAKRDTVSNQTFFEDLANAITHGIGFGLAIAALVILVTNAAIAGSPIRVVTFSIYGASLVILYLASTLYHSIKNVRAKTILKLIDHISVYLLIAGSYTPIMLVMVRGGWGWSLFGVLWGFALAGIILKFFFVGQFEVLETIIYLIMGWLLVLFAYPVMTHFTPMAIAWLLIGGVSYSIGTIFFLWEKLPFHHAIWHLFVLGGSISHFFLFVFHVLPMKG